MIIDPRRKRFVINMQLRRQSQAYPTENKPEFLKNAKGVSEKSQR